MDQPIETTYRGLHVSLRNEPTYRSGATGNERSYQREHTFGDEYVMCAHGVRCVDDSGREHSCILLAANAPTTVHRHSHVFADGALLVAVGNIVCRLSLPELKIVWQVAVDCAACFGVYRPDKKPYVICHGEVEITRLGLDGRIDWQISGRDIFIGDFEIVDGRIETEDFRRNRYRIDAKTGETEVREPEAKSR